jgi:hypothetical protein
MQVRGFVLASRPKQFIDGHFQTSLACIPDVLAKLAQHRTGVKGEGGIMNGEF